jgi:hypothetical protein
VEKMGNYLMEDKERKMAFLKRWLLAAKEKGVDIDLKKIRAVFMDDFNIYPSLLDKYLKDLEGRGMIQMDKANNKIIVL